MIKKMFKKVQKGFTPVQLAVVVGLGAFLAAGLIFMATSPSRMAQVPNRTPDAFAQAGDVCGDGAITGAETCDEGLRCQFDSFGAPVDKCGAGYPPCPTSFGDVIKCIPANSYCTGLYFGAAVACETNADCAAVSGWADLGTCEAQSVSANTPPWDSCDENCQVTINLCGNGNLDAGETCDDGNQEGGDYCSSDCQVETGYYGDFIAQSNEQCDDGDSDDTNGCSNAGIVKVECPGTISGATCTLSPSNELDGVKDVSNIQSALYWAKGMSGGTVHLTSGDFYVSRNIVVDGFTGTLEGAGMDNTTINVGRRYAADGGGFSPAYHPLWDQLGFINILPTVLQLDNSTGLVTIADLTIEVAGANPTDVIPEYYGNDSSAIGTVIDIQEGDNSTDIHNVRLLGAETNAYGNANGKNVGYGFHDMSITLIKPDLTIKNIEVENMAYPAILAMGWDNVTIDGVMLKDVSTGILLRRDSKVTIKDSTLEVRSVGIILEGISGAVVNNNTINMLGSGFASMGIWESPDAKITNNTITGNSVYGVNIWPAESSGALIQGNTFKDGYAIYGHVSLEESNNSTVKGNTFENTRGLRSGGVTILFGAGGNVITKNKFVNVSSDWKWGAILDVWGVNNSIRNNDYSQSGLLGWEFGEDPVWGVTQEGAIHLLNASGDHAVESVSPTGTTFPLGTNLCSQVLDNGSNNNISGFAACEAGNNPDKWQDKVDRLKIELAEQRENMPERHLGWYR